METKVCTACGRAYVRRHVRSDQWARSHYCSPSCVHVGRTAEIAARDEAERLAGVLPERVIAKLAIGDCWEWTGSLVSGYGRTRLAGKQVQVHRLVWQRLVGPIPDGLEIDHLCRNRRCCNPDHLEPVTKKVNRLRGYGTPALAARRTTCPQGHPYDTLLQNGKGIIARSCKRCNNEKSKRYQARMAIRCW